MLDPEGQTIGSALENLGYDEVERVRAGRLVRLRLSASNAAAARERVVKMCEELIANPVIEDYEVRVEPDGAGDGPAGGDGAGGDGPDGDGPAGAVSAGDDPAGAGDP